MREHELRSGLRGVLLDRYRHDPDTLLISELGLCMGATRVDLAVVNGLLAGYEIKSQRDTLRRLPAQAALYSRILDEATIVASTRHLGPAMEIVPDWWGVLEAASPGQFDVVRSAGVNPAVDREALVQLLWRDELFAAVAERVESRRGLAKLTRGQLASRLIEMVSLDSLRTEVRRALRSRRSWPPVRPQS